MTGHDQRQRPRSRKAWNGLAAQNARARLHQALIQCPGQPARAATMADEAMQKAMCARTIDIRQRED